MVSEKEVNIRICHHMNTTRLQFDTKKQDLQYIGQRFGKVSLIKIKSHVKEIKFNYGVRSFLGRKMKLTFDLNNSFFLKEKNGANL